MNILFIISDQHQWRYLSHGGHPAVRTPHLDRLAREGVRFSDAYCQSPLCGPSRASVMTGLYPHTNRQYTHGGFPLPEDMPTLGTVFRQAGYATGAIGKVHILGETRERDLGFDDRQMRLYTHRFSDYIAAVGEDAVNRYATYRKPLPRFQTVYNPTNAPVDLRDDQMFDHLVVERCIEFMEKVAGAASAGETRESGGGSSGHTPFILWAGLEKPHTDWTAPARYHAMYDPRDMVLPPTVGEDRTDMPNAWYASTRQSWCFDEDEIRHCLAAYCANVTYLDDHIGRLLAALDRLGLAEDTLVVYTTDHGEMCFDHGMVQKQNFFEESVRVPLLVRLPDGTGAGSVRSEPVELVDLFPTFCELAGVTAPSALDGRSLAAALRHGAALDPHRPVFSEYYEWGMPERMVRQGDWKYMHATGDQCQLYNLADDPRETRNRVADPACRERVRQLQDCVLTGWEQPDMSTVPHGGIWNTIDAQTHRRLMAEWWRTRCRVPYQKP